MDRHETHNVWQIGLTSANAFVVAPASHWVRSERDSIALRTAVSDVSEVTMTDSSDYPGKDAHDIGQRFVGVMGRKGPPVLLLHGYPETYAAWHEVAPTLAKHHTVVVPDLPRYGRSLLTDAGAWDKREVAAELVAMMRHLGQERFHVAGYDRGARVG